MLSTKYRLRMEFICSRIINGEEVQLDDMIWANKLAKANASAAEMLRKARRIVANPDVEKGGLDDFMIQMGLGDPDPSNHKKGFQDTDDIAEWLHSIDEDVRVFYLDKDFTQRQFDAEFGVGTDYPQVQVGVEHRGSLKETLHYLKNVERIN